MGMGLRDFSQPRKAPSNLVSGGAHSSSLNLPVYFELYEHTFGLALPDWHSPELFSTHPRQRFVCVLLVTQWTQSEGLQPRRRPSTS